MPTIHEYPAYWRSKDRRNPPIVEVVADPDKAWFESVTLDRDRRIVRLAVMEDGQIYFGDAMHVVHADIMRCQGANGTGPMYVAVIVETKGEWRYAIVQQFLGGGTGEEQRAKNLRALVGRMTNWLAVVKELGQDPFTKKIGIDEEDL